MLEKRLKVNRFAAKIQLILLFSIVLDCPLYLQSQGTFKRILLHLCLSSMGNGCEGFNLSVEK